MNFHNQKVLTSILALFIKTIPKDSFLNFILRLLVQIIKLSQVIWSLSRALIKLELLVFEIRSVLSRTRIKTVIPMVYAK